MSVKGVLPILGSYDDTAVGLPLYFLGKEEKSMEVSEFREEGSEALFFAISDFGFGFEEYP